jgi:hypothetical protein
MTASEAIWSATRQHLFLFSGFTIFSAVIALGQTLFGKTEATWMALMTGVWVLINGGIAAWLFQHVHVPAPELLPHVFSHIKSYMWLNVVADAMYGLAGLFLLSRVGTHRAMLRGFGRAVLIQAVGLAILDVIFLAKVIALHNQFLAG